MNIKFEIINGQLCRMVEPEPLTDNTKYPCIMTRKYRSPSAMDYLNEYMVIGYPVADGSAEWALWHRQNKRSVITDTGVVMHYNYDDETCNALLRVYPTGWQLYEPEPLLADAKVGDLCKTDLDEWIQIDDTSEPPNPILYHFDRPFNGNIIHTEPLAPEGTDKWAWQMMLLGKKVCQKHNSYFPNKRYYAIKDGNDYCAFYENNGNEVNITNTRRTYDEFIEYCKFTPQYNWQLYKEPQTEPCEICGGIGIISCEACNATGRVPVEPEPQPAYAVGDCRIEFVKQELHNLLDKL